MAEAIKYEEFTSKHESCYHCSGFYGPCFGEPLCATCHAFLCPHDPFRRDVPIQLCDLKADECDSGNEEPRDSQQDCVQPRVVQLMNQHILYRYPTVNDQSSSSSSVAPAFRHDGDAEADSPSIQVYSNDYHHNHPANGDAQEAIQHDNDAVVNDVAATYSKYILARHNNAAEAEEGMNVSLIDMRRAAMAVPVQNGAAGACGGSSAAVAERAGGLDGARAVSGGEASNANEINGAACVHQQGRRRRRTCNQGDQSSDSDCDSEQAGSPQRAVLSNGSAEASGYDRDQEDDYNSFYREGSNNNTNHRTEGNLGDRGRLHRAKIRERRFARLGDGAPPDNDRPVDPLALYRVLGLVGERNEATLGNEVGAVASVARSFNRVSLNDAAENGVHDRAADNSEEANNLFCKEVWQKLNPEARASVIYGNGRTEKKTAPAFGYVPLPTLSRASSREATNGPACSCSSSQTGHLLQERLCLLTNPVRYGDTEPSTLAGRMPPEVWIMVFRLLDDVSLWQCTRVSTAWRHLVLSNWGENSWQRFTNSRWRFFRPIFTPVHWYAIFSSLLESSPCRPCQAQRLQPLDPASLVEQNSWRMTRLQNEKRSLAMDPPEGIEAIPLEPQLLHWQAAIRGPDKSPYMGGTFYLHILIPPRYPLGPPVVRFFTKIFHPNVSCHGDIGIDSIQHNWSLALTISKVLISIQSLLTDPYTKVCMEPYAGKLYETDRTKFEKIAREWTWRYAMPDALHPHPCQDELRLCEAATEGYEDSLMDDLSPLMLAGEDDQDNNDPDQDENDQENNDVYIENNDPEEANLILEPQLNNPELEDNLNNGPVQANPIHELQVISPEPQGILNNGLVQANGMEEPRAINPELDSNLNNGLEQANGIEEPPAINPELDGNLNNGLEHANGMEEAQLPQPADNRT